MNVMIFLLLCLCAIKASGGYIKGEAGKECPSEVLIKTNQTCVKYADDEAMTYNGTERNNTFPRGCFQINQTVYFNDVEHGKPSPKASPICFDNSEISETEAVADAMRYYGISFAICFLLYIIVRPQFPLLYNFRNSVAEFNTPLAKDNHGKFRWIWCIFKHSDDEIFQYCGMDGVVLIRILRLGLKLSLVGVFNSLYLIPVYFFHPHIKEDEEYGALDKLSLSAVRKDSNALFATIFSAYVLFSSTMYFLFREFEWFTTARHKFLRKPRPDNYTVYVANIPQEYRSDIALLEYFQSIFGASDVIDSKIARDIPILDSKVAARELAITNLERAIYLQDLKGIDAQSSNMVEENDPIPACNIELEDLNSEISNMISQIEIRRSKEAEKFRHDSLALSKIIPQSKPLDSNLLMEQGTRNDVMDLSVDSSEEGLVADMKDLTVDSAKAAIRVGYDTLQMPKKIVRVVAGSRDEDGEPRDAGFVSFSRLWCNAQATQILHDRVPFAFEVTNAPLPKYIFWHNVGLSRRKKQVGAIIANALWIALSLVYLPLTAAVVGATQIEKILPNVKEPSELLMKVSALLSPLALVLLSVSVPPILRYIGKYEGHISLTALEASLFSKYAVFYVIQNFFTQTLFRAFMLQREQILKDNTLLLDFLGTSVPNQVGILIQYVLLRTILTCILELLRVPVVILSLLRRMFGPKWTKNKQNSTWLGMSRLSVPHRLNYPIAMSYLMINFLCLFVFSCIAPVMSVILVFVFGLLNLTYRNQLIYVYSHESDTGGQLWMRFMKLIITLMMVSECLLIAVIFSKCTLNLHGLFHTASLVLLLIITVLFSRHLEKQHYRAAEYLPSISCQKEDSKNFNQDMSFVKGKYIQPALEKNMVSIDCDNRARYDCSEEKNDVETSIMDSSEKQPISGRLMSHLP